MTVYDIIIFILVMASIFVIYYIIKKPKKTPNEAGRNMTRTGAVSKPLGIARRFAMLNGHKVITDLSLAKDGKFADFDFAIIGTFGIICVKCVGLSGEIYGAVDDDEWLQVHKGKRVHFENPLKKAVGDTRVVRDTLFFAKLKNIPVSSAVVFTNKKASLAIPRSTEFFTTKTFKEHLNKEAFILDKKVPVDSAVSAIEAFIAKK